MKPGMRPSSIRSRSVGATPASPLLLPSSRGSCRSPADSVTMGKAVGAATGKTSELPILTGGGTLGGVCQSCPTVDRLSQTTFPR